MNTMQRGSGYQNKLLTIVGSRCSPTKWLAVGDGAIVESQLRFYSTLNNNTTTTYGNNPKKDQDFRLG